MQSKNETDTTMTNKRLSFLGKSFLIAAFAIGSALACNSKPTVLKVGYIPIADCAQLFIAQDKGLFAQNGLTVELTSMAGGAPILEAVGAGSLDVGFSNVVSLVLAHANGLPFVAFTGGPAEDSAHQEHGLFVSQTAAIADVKGLAGKKIALNTRRNIDELMVSELLLSQGVDLKGIQFLEVPFPRMVNVLEAGGVDAIAPIEPFVTAASDRGHRLLSSNYVAVQPVTEISSYVASQAWITAHPKEAKAFSQAIAAAGEMANRDPSVARAALQAHTSLTPEQLSRIALPWFTSALSESGLQTMIGRAVKAGWISASFAAKDLIAR